MNQGKLDRLQEILAGVTPAVIAMSGGLDSRFLAQTIWSLGFEAVPVFFQGPQNTPKERAWVREWVHSEGHRLHVLELSPLNLPEAALNTSRRCYHCKLGLFARAWGLARDIGLQHVLDGGNASDLGEYRPGLKALAELGVNSPLALAGLTKADIRREAVACGLARPDQASRPCLMTRFAYGIAPSNRDLENLGLAEDALAGLGLKDFRLRRPSLREYVLHLASSEVEIWNSLEREGLRVLTDFGIQSVSVVTTESLSGFYDREPL